MTTMMQVKSEADAFSLLIYRLGQQFRAEIIRGLDEPEISGHLAVLLGESAAAYLRDLNGEYAAQIFDTNRDSVILRVYIDDGKTYEAHPSSGYVVDIDTAVSI